MGSDGETYRVPKTCLGRREKRQRLASRSDPLVGCCNRLCDLLSSYPTCPSPASYCSCCISSLVSCLLSILSSSSFFLLSPFPPPLSIYRTRRCSQIGRATHQKSYDEWNGGVDSSQLYPAIWRRRSNSRGGGGGSGSSTSSGTRAGPSMLARGHRKKEKHPAGCSGRGRCSARSLSRRSSKPARSAHHRPGGYRQRRMDIAASSAAIGKGRVVGYFGWDFGQFCYFLRCSAGCRSRGLRL